MGMRDMYSAISGLQANSTWLDVIGNNISNVNTVAYKASRAEFASAFSQTLNFRDRVTIPEAIWAASIPSRLG